MITVALSAAGALVALGYIPAVALVGDRIRAVALAPLVTALALCAAGVVTAVTATPPAPWGVLCLLAMNVIGLMHFRRRAPSVGEPAPPGSLVIRLVPSLLVALPLVGLLRPMVDWDAHSIWLFHAKWYAEGGAAAHDVFASFTSSGTNDYPPLVPATAGVLSALVGSSPSYELEQAVTAILGYCCLVWLAWLVGDIADADDDARARWAWVGGGVAVALTLCASVPLGLTNGLVDTVCAAAGVAGAAGLLLRDPHRHAIGPALVLLAVSTLTKNEGAPIAVVAIAVFLLRHRRAAPWRPLVAVLALPVLWRVATRVLGAESYLTADGNVHRVVGHLGDVFDRLRPSLRAMFDQVALLLVLAVIVTAIGAAVGPLPRRRAVLRRVVPLWLCAVAATGSTLVVYLLGPYDIAWFLRTSVDRTMMSTNGLLALIALTAAATTLRGAPTSSPDDRAPAVLG